jgi:anti-sigma regulatory factor (Ser/Thr protein kinase)
MSLIERARLTKYSPSSIDRDTPSVRESYLAVAESVPVARRAITACAAAAGAGPEQLEAIELAVSEALTNVVLYAYPWRTGEIHVTARVAGHELWVLIADNGCGLHAGRDTDGLGLGLALISKMTDGFSVVGRSSGGTELRLRFALGNG